MVLTATNQNQPIFHPGPVTPSHGSETPAEGAILRFSAPTAAGNPAGMTARTFRKTWESWLLAACPAEIVRITISQGHSETIALRHYLNCSWTAAEREAIRAEVFGWCR